MSIEIEEQFPVHRTQSDGFSIISLLDDHIALKEVSAFMSQSCFSEVEIEPIKLLMSFKKFRSLTTLYYGNFITEEQMKKAFKISMLDRTDIAEVTLARSLNLLDDQELLDSLIESFISERGTLDTEILTSIRLERTALVAKQYSSLLRTLLEEIHMFGLYSYLESSEAVKKLRHDELNYLKTEEESVFLLISAYLEGRIRKNPLLIKAIPAVLFCQVIEDPLLYPYYRRALSGIAERAFNYVDYWNSSLYGEVPDKGHLFMVKSVLYLASYDTLSDSKRLTILAIIDGNGSWRSADKLTVYTPNYSLFRISFSRGFPSLEEL